jgi:hypothetical protein
MKMEQTECSETSAYKIQTPGNYPEENIQQYPKSLGYDSVDWIHLKDSTFVSREHGNEIV